MKRLPDVCILKNEYGEYLSLRGSPTGLRKNAAVLLRSDAAQVLAAFMPDRSRRAISTLSIEELPKRERRGNPHMSSTDVAGLVKAIKVSELTTKADRLRREAVHHTKTAADYEAQAARVDALLATLKGTL